MTIDTQNLAQKNIMAANQNACLANLATLFYVSVVFSVGTFVGQKTYMAILNTSFPSSVDVTGKNDDINVKYMRGGFNTSLSRKLAAVHGNAIWGVIRNNDFWEEYKETTKTTRKN